MKEKDWFLELLNNPGFTNTDFKLVGVTATNTSIANADVYKNNEYIRQQFKTEDGKFDEKAFDKAYDYALYTYNKLSLDTYQDDINKTYKAHKDNIFVSPENRAKIEDQLNITLRVNPLEETTSIQEVGLTTPGPLTVEEIAQELQVYNPLTGEYSDSPNDSFFSNFFNTLVLAEWEYNADKNGLPTENEDEIVYLKGQYKLNDKGKPYYEYLNGRSVVGKNVLHKSDILTDDRDSALNAIDFFDNDGYEKSTFGVLMKNLVSIAPMLIPHTAVPYLASVYIGTGVALNFGKMLTTAAKMIGGSEVGILNNTEGFIDSLAISLPKYSTKGQWSLANIIDLGGMVFKQLSELRWLFKYGPALLKGTLWDDAAQQTFKKNKLDELDDALNAKLKDLMDNPDFVKFLSEGKIANNSKVAAMVSEKTKEFNKLGELLARIYMTGLVVADAYNDAKSQNLSDGEAAAYTLAYAIGEYMVLKTDIGRWVMPELKATAHKFRKMEQVLTPDIAKATGEVYKRSVSTAAYKQAIASNKISKAFKKGLEKAKIDSRMGTNLSKFAFANALSEGVEETSEEFLADLSKSLFNVYSYITGDSSRLNSWDNMFDRYSMSFVGGIMGGGLFSITPDLKKLYKGIESMSREDALKEVMSMSRNGELDSFVDHIHKNVLGNLYLSTNIIKDENGESIFAQANGQDNQDTAVKNILMMEIKIIDDIINKHNVKFSNDSLLDAAILSDVKYSRLLLSTQAGRYISSFENELADLVKLEAKLQGLSTPSNNTLQNMAEDKKDANKKDDVAEKIQEEERLKLINLVKKEIQETEKSLLEYGDGTKAPEFILNAIFELEQSLSLPYIAGTLSTFAKVKTGKSIDLLNDDEITELRSLFKLYREGTFADNVETARAMFDAVLDTLAPHITLEFMDKFKYPHELVLKLANIVLGLDVMPVDVNGETKYKLALTLGEYQLLLNDALLAIKLAIIEAGGDTEISIGQTEKYTLLEAQSRLQDLIAKHNLEVQDLVVLLQNLDSAIAKAEELGILIKNSSEEQLQAASQEEAFKEAISQYVEARDAFAKKQEEIEQSNDSINIYKELIDAGIDKSFASNIKILEYILTSEVFSPLVKLSLLDIITTINKNNPDELLYQEAYDVIHHILDNPAHLMTKELGLILGKSINIPTLVKQLEVLIMRAKDDLTNFVLSEDQLNALVEAINMISLLRSALYGFRYDAQIDNIFGYSATKNELIEGSNLPLWLSLELDPILELMELLEKLLHYYKRIVEISTGQKIKVQERTSTNLNLLLYKRILKFSIYVPDDWVGKLEFTLTLESLEGLKTLVELGRIDASFEESKALEYEIQKMELAVHNLFAANMEKLKDVETMSSIFSLSNFPGFVQDHNEVIDDKSTDLDDKSFFWYLSALAAINPSDFYFKYKLSISDSDKAPIRVQELATFIGYSNLMNVGVFNIFTDILKNTIVTLKPVANHGADYDPDYKRGSAYYPRFGDVVFIEGVPGAGKSDVVLRNIINLLGPDHPLMQSVIMVHSSEKNALETAENIGFDTMHTFDRKGTLNYVSTNHLSKFDEENDGQYFKTNDDLTVESDGYYYTNSEIKSIDPAPTLMIIDEISLWSAMDLDSIYKFCKKHGTRLIVLGDTFLTTLRSYAAKNPQTGEPTKVKPLGLTDSEGIVYTGDLHKDFFAHGPKLGISMRTNNVLQEMNEIIMRQAIATEEPPMDQFPLHYYENENGLFGMRVLASLDFYRDEYLRILRMMKSTLKDGQKIGYIYSKSEDNILEQLLENDEEFKEFKELIDKQEGVTSSGLLAQYYIIEDTDYVDIKKLYTSITRASLGGMIILQGDPSVVVTSQKDLSTTMTGLDPVTIKEYAKRRFNILDEVYKDGNEIKYIPDGNVSAPSNNTTTITNEDGEIDEVKTNESTSINNVERARMKAMDIAQDGFVQMLWTFNTTSYVLEDDSNRDDMKFRIDSLLGISRLPSVLAQLEGLNDILKKIKLIEIHDRIKSALVHALSEDNAIEIISEILDIEKDRISLDVGLKSSYIASGPTKGYLRFWIGLEESVLLKNPNGDPKPNIKKIVGLIKIDGKYAVESSLYTINNWETLLEHPDYANLKDMFIKFKQSSWSRKDRLLGGEMLRGGLLSEAFGLYIMDKVSRSTSLTEKEKHMMSSYALLCIIYKFTSNGMFLLSPNNRKKFFTDAQSTGPMLRSTTITNNNGYAIYEPETNPINKQLSSDFVHTNIKVNTSEITIEALGVTIPPGKPYILVSDNLEVTKELLEDYIQGKKKIPELDKAHMSIIFLNNPVLGYEEYFDYISKLVEEKNETKGKKKSEIFDPDIGNELTDFYIVTELVQNLNEELLKEINIPSAVEEFKKIQEELTAIDNSSTLSPKLKHQERLKILDRKYIDNKMAGNTGKTSIRNICRSTIRYINAGSTNNSLKEALLNAAKTVFGENNGILCNVRLDKTVAGQGSIIDVKTKMNDPFAIVILGQTLHFTVNGKLDPSATFADFDMFIETFNLHLVVTDDKGNPLPVPTSDQNDIYLERKPKEKKSAPEVKNEPLFDPIEFINEFVGSNNDLKQALISYVTEANNNKSKVDEFTIAKAASSMGYFVVIKGSLTDVKFLVSTTRVENDTLESSTFTIGTMDVMYPNSVTNILATKLADGTYEFTYEEVLLDNNEPQVIGNTPIELLELQLVQALGNLPNNPQVTRLRSLCSNKAYGMAEKAINKLLESNNAVYSVVQYEAVKLILTDILLQEQPRQDNCRINIINF